MKKLFYIIFVVLILSLSCYASKPKFDYKVKVNKTLSPVRISSVEIILNPAGYEYDEYNLSTFKNFTVQQYDKINWLGSKTIRIVSDDGSVDEIVLPGNSFYVSKNIRHHYYSISNSSLGGYFNVIDKNISRINIKFNSDKIKYSFSDNDFYLNDEKVVKVNTYVDDDLPPGIYPADIIISNKFYTYNNSINFENPARYDWVVVEETINKTHEIKSGEFKPLGHIKITNRGNLDFVVKLEFSGNGSSFVESQAEQTIYKKTNVYFNILGRVPFKQKEGEYIVDATLSDFYGHKKTYSFKIKIIDAELPKINRITVDDNVVYHDTTFKIDATDNIDVAKVIIKYDGSEHQTEKDQNLFTYTTKFTNPGNKSFLICAYDNSGNEKCIFYNTTIKKLDVLSVKSNLKLPSYKYGKYVSVDLLNISEKIPHKVEVRLLEFLSEKKDNISLGKDYKIRIVDGDGSVQKFSSINDTVDLYNEGIIKFEILGYLTGKYEGLLEIVPPSYVSNKTYVRFSGKFLDYDIPKPFTMQWVNSNVTCDVIDKGNLEDSYYLCTIKYPISIKKEHLTIPMTEEDREKMRQEFNQTAVEYQKKISNLKIYISILVSLLFFTGGYLYYGAKIYPYVRFKYGNK